MYIVAVVSNTDDTGKYEEYFSCPDGATDDQILDLIDTIIKNFNDTLRPGQIPRKVLEVYEDSEADHEYTPLIKHSWSKSSLVTERGGYDNYRCEKCGITGRRYGLDSHIRRDNKYKARKYDGCVL